MINFIRIIFRHELRDFLRDRSTLKTMFVILGFMPILFSRIIGDVENRVKDVREKDKRVGYIQRESESISEIIPFLRQQGIQMVPVTQLDRATFVDNKLDALLAERKKTVLDSPDNFSKSFDLWTSGSNEKQLAGVHYIQNLIASYGQSLGRRHLILRGVSPELMEPLHVEVKSIDEDKSSGFAVLDLLVSLLGMGIFFSTLHLAVDTTAGERERQTLESMFYTAAPRTAFVLSKWLLITLLVFLSGWMVGTIFWMLGEFSIFQTLLSRTTTFPYRELLRGLLIFFPLCPMIAAMQIMIGSLSTSVKQAQAFNGVSSLLSLPLSFLMFVDDIKALNWAPIFGQGLAFRRILHGEEFDLAALLGAEALTLTLAVLMGGFVIRRFNEEKMIYAS